MRTAEETVSLGLPPAGLCQTSPSELELADRSRVLRWIGLPLLGFGIFLTWSGVRILTDPERSMDEGVIDATIVGLGCVALAGFCFWRRRLTLDRTRGTLIRRWWWGPVPLRWQERQLNEFDAIVVAYDVAHVEWVNEPDAIIVANHVAHVERGIRILFSLRLRAIDGRDFVISRAGGYRRLLQQAEYVSRFLDLPVVDATPGPYTVFRPY